MQDDLEPHILAVDGHEEEEEMMMIMSDEDGLCSLVTEDDQEIEDEEEDSDEEEIFNSSRHRALCNEGAKLNGQTSMSKLNIIILSNFFLFSY